MIVIEQQYYRKKLVDSSIDWATTETAIDLLLISSSQLFVFEIYNCQEVDWLSLNKNTLEWKLVGNRIDWATTNTTIDICYVLFINTSSNLTWTPHLESIELNPVDNHKLLHFNTPTTDIVLLLIHC